jgi:hypothetical protein
MQFLKMIQRKNIITLTKSEQISKSLLMKLQVKDVTLLMIQSS